MLKHARYLGCSWNVPYLLIVLQGHILKLKLGWVVVYTCIVELGLATQHWSGKSEVYMCLVQLACGACFCREVSGMSPRKLFKNTCSEIEFEGIFKIM